MNEYADFPHIGQVFCIGRETVHPKSGKETREVVYGVTSLSPQQADPKRLLGLNRGHWAIENRSHYVRDVTFDEDRSQIRTKNAPRVMASIRNLVISVLRLLGATNIAGALRTMAGKPHLTLAALRL